MSRYKVEKYLKYTTFVAIIAGALLAGVSVPQIASAQATPAPGKLPTAAASPAPVVAPSPSPSPSPPPKFIQFSGFSDIGFTSFGSGGSAKFTNGSNSRVFDLYNEQPTLQNLNIQSVISAGALGAKVEVSLGTDADIIAAYPGAFNGVDLTQAYASYTAGKLTLIGGKFETLAGAEVIESPSNSQFSRSILFGYAVPFTHTGGRLTYAVTPQLSAILGVNAGWDDLKDTNGEKTAEYGIAYNPSSAVGLTAQGYTGFEQLSNVPLSTQQGQRTLIDVVATVKPTSLLSFVLNYDHGRQANAAAFTTDGAALANWSGLAGYANYQATPRTTVGVRFEGFKDNDGYRTGINQFWHEGTATVGYSPSSALTFRGEYRYDRSSTPVFARLTSPIGSNYQQSLGLEALVKF